MLTVYGIKQCDTCRKTTKWLAQEGIAHQFHDLRSDGLDADMIRSWLRDVSADALLNRRSTSWRQLDEKARAFADQAELIDLLLEYPTLIKRPVVAEGGVLSVGFAPDKWA